MTLEELFYKYLDEKMSPGELRLFREMASREESRAELDRLFAAWIGNDFPFAQNEDIDIDAMYLDLIETRNIPVAAEHLIGAERPIARERPRFVLYRRRLINLGTALAAACLLAVAGLFLMRQRIPPVPPLAAKPTPIVAASDKAVLTLADGSRIVLDSVAAGNLAVQGNVQVVKLAGGQLAYRPAGGNDAHPVYNVMTTPRGGYYQLVLPDGSKVWLDAASSLRYPTSFAGKERSVELTGEAYFEIAPQKNQPFMVSSNGVTVEVLGTAFNMMAYPEEDAVRTTLVDGAVKVVAGNDRQQIRPGQQAAWARGGSKLELSIPDMQQVLAWRREEFRFQDMKIGAIMRQISRWYDVDVEFRGVLPGNEFNGVISRKKEVTELLTVLEQTEDVHFVLEGRKIVVETILPP
jgi:ferric-dicitrate binding protein FerR (iron transport regulator)